MERIYEETASGELIPKEEIIRCKDCRYGGAWNTNENNETLGECHLDYFSISPTDFCPYGKKSIDKE